MWFEDFLKGVGVILGVMLFGGVVFLVFAMIVMGFMAIFDVNSRSLATIMIYLTGIVFAGGVFTAIVGRRKSS